MLRITCAADWVETDPNDAGPGRYHVPPWGPWTLHRRRAVLTHRASHYEIDLDSCRHSPEVLDWICQITGKSWADNACIAGLVRALNDVLEPQACLCSFGQHLTITKADIRSLINRENISPDYIHQPKGTEK